MLFRPFEIFKLDYISRLVELKKIYLVSQTLRHIGDHFADEHKPGILLSDYDDENAAKMHLNAVKHDKYAAIIDLTKEKHIAKLMQMLSPDSAYTVFWSTVKSRKEVKKRMDLKYKENIRRYISTQTNWRVKGDENIRTDLYLAYGELFVTLKRGAQTISVEFEKIEKA